MVKKWIINKINNKTERAVKSRSVNRQRIECVEEDANDAESAKDHFCLVFLVFLVVGYKKEVFALPFRIKCDLVKQVLGDRWTCSQRRLNRRL